MEKRKAKGKAKRKKEKVKREFSAGGVVFKKEKGSLLWLITFSSSSELYPKSYWRLPKGWLDDENDGRKPGPLGKGEKKAKEKELQKAALREVAEEGGVEAKIVKKLGTEKIFFTRKSGEKILKFVTYYLMEHADDLAEGPGFETTEVKFVPFKKARELLKYEGEKKVLDRARKVLSSKAQEK